MLFRSPDKDAFAREIGRAAEAAGLGPLAYDPDAFSLRPAGADIVLYLNNAYAEYRAALPWQRGRIVARYVRQFTGLARTREEVTAPQARAMLRPRLRERAFHAFLTLRAEAEGRDGPDTPFRELGGGHLTLEVVLDRPDTVTSVGAAQLAEWGLTFEEALAIGNENLLRLGTDRFRSPRPGLFVSDWHDVYDASRLHLPDVVGGLSVRGRPVAMAPNRDVLLVTGADDAEGLVLLARLAEEALKRPRPMSGYAFRLDGGWVPFLPPAGHPASLPLHRLAVQTLAGHYEDQKGLLEARCERRGEDVYVAGVLVIEDRETGDLTTASSWAAGVETLLPRTDRVAFSRPGAGGKADLLGLADWARVEEVAGDLLEPQGLYPERYRVRDFPSEARLRDLRLT